MAKIIVGNGARVRCNLTRKRYVLRRQQVFTIAELRILDASGNLMLKRRISEQRVREALVSILSGGAIPLLQQEDEAEPKMSYSDAHPRLSPLVGQLEDAFSKFSRLAEDIWFMEFVDGGTFRDLVYQSGWTADEAIDVIRNGMRLQ